MARPARMLRNEELAELLSLQNLNLPSPPKVVDVKFEEYEDWTGEESLRVYVILDDRTRDEDWRLDRIQPIQDGIRSALRAAGEERWVYFNFGTREHYDRRYNYDPATDE